MTLFVVPYALMMPKFLSDLESRAFCQSPRELIEVAERHELALLYSWQMLSWSYILGVYIVSLMAKAGSKTFPAALRKPFLQGGEVVLPSSYRGA